MYKKYAELRDERKISDYEVSKNTGIATATLSNWKHGRYTPKLDKIQALAKFFGVPIEYFVNEER